MCSVELLTTTRNLGSKNDVYATVHHTSNLLFISVSHPKMNPQEDRNQQQQQTRSHFILISTLGEQQESEAANFLHTQKCNSGTFRCFSELPFKTQASCVRGLLEISH